MTTKAPARKVSFSVHKDIKPEDKPINISFKLEEDVDGLIELVAIEDDGVESRILTIDPEAGVITMEEGVPPDIGFKVDKYGEVAVVSNNTEHRRTER